MANIIIPDKYNMAEFVEQLKAKHIPDMSENALLISTLGFIGDVFVNQLATDLTVMSEISNEALPLKAKYDRDILTHAIQVSITDLYATPSYMDVQICISEEALSNNINDSNTFILDKKTKFSIEDFEFHLDYDIIINRSKPYNYSTDGYVYIAQYDIKEINPISNISSPYLPPPSKINISGSDFIMIYARIRQVEPSIINKKITSDDAIQNKTFEFSFDSQMSYFDMVVTDPNGITTTLTPIFEGVPINDNSKNYFYYTHIDSSTIRVKFISTYYNPTLNSMISIRLYTTQGKRGNFVYKTSFLVNPESDIFTYNGMVLYVLPYTNADYGSDQKSISDLKREIPMRALARDSITSDKDIENYFNILNDDRNRTVISKQVQNQNTLKFYLYILMKDSFDNVIPTNTLPLKLSNTYMNNNNDTIKPGTLFQYNPLQDIAEVSTQNVTIENNDFQNFFFSLPFLIKVTRSPILHLSYYLNIIDISYQTNFTYINKNAFLQFICTSVNIKREFLTDRNKYKITASLTQNINEEFDIVDVNSKGEVIDSTNFKTFIVFYDQFGNPVKYKMCNILNYDNNLKEYDIEAILETQDVFDITGKLINITNLNDFRATTTSDTYLPRQTKIVLYTAYKLKDSTISDLNDAKLYVPGLDGYIVSNKYTVDPGLDFYLNFSEIVNSSISVSKPSTEVIFNISSVPMIQYLYMQNEDHVEDIINSFVTRKLYIDEAMKQLQDPLGIDLKLFNTYGPSKTYMVGHNKTLLNRTNIILKLRLKLDITAADNLKEVIITDIKGYIENINDIKDFHYSSLDQYLRNKYSSIRWIEFLGINNYGTDNQYIVKDNTIDNYVPEFLNVDTTTGKPAIEITVV